MGISLRNRVSCWSVLKHSPELQTSLCPKCLFLIISPPDESQPPLTPANDWPLKVLHGSKFCRLTGTCGSAASPSFQPGVRSCPEKDQGTHQESQCHHPTATNPPVQLWEPLHPRWMVPALRAATSPSSPRAPLWADCRGGGAGQVPHEHSLKAPCPSSSPVSSNLQPPQSQ